MIGPSAHVKSKRTTPRNSRSRRPFGYLSKSSAGGAIRVKNNKPNGLIYTWGCTLWCSLNKRPLRGAKLSMRSGSRYSCTPCRKILRPYRSLPWLRNLSVTWKGRFLRSWSGNPKETSIVLWWAARHTRCALPSGLSLPKQSRRRPCRCVPTARPPSLERCKSVSVRDLAS